MGRYDTFRDVDRNPQAHPIPGLLARIGGEAIFLEVDDAAQHFLSIDASDTDETNSGEPGRDEA